MTEKFTCTISYAYEHKLTKKFLITYRGVQIDRIKKGLGRSYTLRGPETGRKGFRLDGNANLEVSPVIQEEAVAV